MTRVVILTGDPVGRRNGGPRDFAPGTWRRELQRHGHDTRVVSTSEATEPGTHEGVTLARVRAGDDRAFFVRTSAGPRSSFFRATGFGQFDSLRAGPPPAQKKPRGGTPTALPRRRRLNAPMHLGKPSSRGATWHPRNVEPAASPPRATA